MNLKNLIKEELQLDQRREIQELEICTCKIWNNIEMDEIIEWSKLSTQNLQKSILLVIWCTSTLSNKLPTYESRKITKLKALVLKNFILL
jgi:hypothetical protein